MPARARFDWPTDRMRFTFETSLVKNCAADEHSVAGA
jgi:hypothetical protein